MGKTIRKGFMEAIRREETDLAHYFIQSPCQKDLKITNSLLLLLLVHDTLFWL